MSLAQASLFDAPPRPVLGAASDWTAGVLGGTLATALCVIAVAILGLLLLSGRLRVRRSVEVVLGCFLLLDAGVLAAQLRQLAGDASGATHAGTAQVILPAPEQTPPLPPANYDPYAGASLRTD
jgi:type IV secretion system protein VirB2